MLDIICINKAIDNTISGFYFALNQVFVLRLPSDTALVSRHRHTTTA
jgi:hypothetical protein